MVGARPAEHWRRLPERASARCQASAATSDEFLRSGPCERVVSNRGSARQALHVRAVEYETAAGNPTEHYGYFRQTRAGSKDEVGAEHHCHVGVARRNL